MTVYELLKAYDNKLYTDVVISGVQYDNCDNDCDYDISDVTLAHWRSKNHNHWYCGQLDYFTKIDCNELEPYFSRTVKSFYIVGDTITLEEIPTIFIELK